MKKLVLISLPIALAFLPWAVLAAELERAITLRCMFTKSFTAEHNEQGGMTSYDKGRNSFGNDSMVYDKIDLEKATARLIGNNGSAELSSGLFIGGLNFIESTGVGSLSITSVFNKTNKDGEYSAVMSRHMSMDGTPVVSQHFGLCKIVESR